MPPFQFYHETKSGATLPNLHKTNSGVFAMKSAEFYVLLILIYVHIFKFQASAYATLMLT